MKPKSVAVLLSVPILFGAAFSFWKLQSHGAVAPIAPIAQLAPAPATSAVPDRPASPKTLARLAPSPEATPSPLDGGPQTSITILVQWADTRAAVEGTSVTLRGTIGGKPAAWNMQALSDKEGGVRTRFPSSFDSLTAVALQPMAAKFAMTFGPGTSATRSAIAPQEPMTDPLVLKLQRGGAISGTVRRADDRRPVAGATVSARLNNDTAAPIAVRSDAEGHYRIDHLPAGALLLEAHASGLFTDNRRPVPIALAAGAESSPHDLLLVAGGTLTGRVTEREGGAPIAGATIGFYPNFQRSSAWAVSGEDGGYALDGVPFRTPFTVSARSPGHAAKIAKSQLGTTGTAHLDFQLGPGGVLEAIAKDEIGQPVENANFTVRPPKNMESVPIALTDAQGRAVLSNLSLDPEPEMEINVWKTGYRRTTPIGAPRFDSRGYALVEATLTKEESIRVEYSGTVADEQGNPLAGIEVAAITNQSGNSPLQSVATGADGAYHLGPLELPRRGSGLFTLRATGKGWASTLKESPRSGPLGLASPVTIDFTMTPGHWVGGKVVDESRKPVAGVHLTIDGSFQGRMAASQVEADSNEAGEFRFTDLPQRSIYLVAFPPLGYGASVSGSAKLDQETEVVMKSPGAVRGRVTDAATGKPVTRFSVSIRAEYEDAAMQPFDDPQGRFVVGQVDRNHPGRVTVESPGYAKYFNGDFRIRGDDSTELDIRLRPAKPPLIISLVDKTSGAPVAGAKVGIGQDPTNDPNRTIFNPERAGARPDPQILTTDASGAVSAAEENGPQAIYIRATGFLNADIPPNERTQYAAADGRLTIPLGRGASISGLVRVDGQIAAKATIYLRATSMQQGRNSSNLNGNTDAEGKFRVSGLLPGAYEISILTYRGGINMSPVTRRIALTQDQDLTVNFGEDAGSSALFGVITRAGKPAAEVGLDLSPAFDWDYLKFGAVTDANGEYKFLGLRPGSYTMTINGDPRPASERVEVGALPTQHDFDFKSVHTVAIHPIYPPDFPRLIRTQIWSAVLSSADAAFDRSNPNRIDRNVQIETTGDRVVFKGRFQGPYRLRMIHHDGTGKSGTIEFSQTLNLDNLNADVDLGDLPVPLPPPPK